MSKKVSAWALALNILLILTLIPTVRFDSARAQESSAEAPIEMGQAEVAPGELVNMQWSAEVPPLTADQQAQLAYWSEQMNRPGPKREGAEREAAAGMEAVDASTASSLAGKAELSPKTPLAPGTAQVYRKIGFGGIIPAGYKSNILEASVGQGGKNVFFTGNWFAARSANGGVNWSYVSPFADYPNFCCDQVTTYDEARNTMYWLRMASPNASGVNTFKLGVSNNGGTSFCTYTFAPTNVNSGWTNQWWDYPHIQLGADYMYIAWNMFNAAQNWTRTVMLRFPLDSLSACAGFNYNYVYTSSWFTFVPVQGADHTMWFASNWPMVSPFNRLAIWRWDEASTSLSSYVRTVAVWNYTNRGQAVCGSTSGNWAGRTDDRLLTGARYMLNGSNLRVPGRNVIAWWWNARGVAGTSLPLPYIDGAAFYEDTLTQVSGLQGRPFIWNSSSCHLYPSAAANQRGDLGLVLHYGPATAYRPLVAFTIADDYVGTPPGFTYFTVVSSNARPSDNKWGDYNTVRTFMPSQDTWTAGSHFIPGTVNCPVCSNPAFFNFGRGRDYQSWFRWMNK